MELSARGLVVHLGARRVLDGVDARLVPGGITAILGSNGSGKSTLVKALAGLILPDAGMVRLDDRPVATLPPRERARMIGYLPQDPVVHWNVPVHELVALGRLPHRSPFAAGSQRDQKAVAMALAATATEELALRRTHELSGGERARVLLARVLAGAPDWLLADEPLASLDPVHQLDLLGQLRALACEGIGVVIVLHDLVQAARAADHILLLNGGRIVAHGPTPSTLTPANLRAAFGIEVTMVPDDQGVLLPIPVGRSTGD